MSKNTEVSAVAKCLVCGRTDDNMRRGLCNTHYTQFHKEKAGKTDAEIDRYEQRLIDAGLLLPNRQGQRGGVENPFRDMAKELFGITAEALGEAAGKSADTDPPKKRPNKKTK